MREMTLEEVDFDYCTSCKGIWFDKDELSAMAELATDVPKLDEARKGATPTSHPCPHCDRTLEEMRFVAAEDLRIDRCPSCQGIWLDKGELKRVEKIAARLENPVSRMMRLCKQLDERGYQILNL